VKSRLIASLVVGAAVLVGTTGCSMISNQATTIPYSAAEGVNVYGSGPLEVRNAFIVANDEGTLGNFVAAVVNQTDESQTLTIEIGQSPDVIRETVRVPANSVISFGSDETEPLLLEGIEMLPGTDVPGFFASGDSEGALVSLPILDGGLDYLAPLVPKG
jgi:hypothetical protein